MKVLQVLNHFLPQQTAGTEVYTWALSKELLKKTIDVKVLIPNYGSTENYKYEYDGIEVNKYAEPSIVDRSLIMGKRVPIGLHSFTELLKNLKPDIVHFHELAGSNGITIHHIKVAKQIGAKTIKTFHLADNSCKTGTLLYKGKEKCDGKINIKKCSSCYLQKKGYEKYSSLILLASKVFYQLNIDSTDWGNRLGTALGTNQLIHQLQYNLKELELYCDQLVSLTDWYKKVLLINGIESSKIMHIAQGLPLQTEVKKCIKNAEPERPLRLIFLGRISKFKGLHLLIEAVMQLPENKLLLDIYGQPAEEEYELNLRNQTLNNKNIRWKGILSQNCVVSTMQNYDVLCLCSTFSEMSPLVIQEAFAAGIPVIASNVNGNSEQIKHNVNGLLFNFNDVYSLIEQLERCINNRDLLVSLGEKIVPPRTFQQIGDEYLSLYQSLLSS